MARGTYCDSIHDVTSHPQGRAGDSAERRPNSSDSHDRDWFESTDRFGRRNGKIGRMQRVIGKSLRRGHQKRLG